MHFLSRTTCLGVGLLFVLAACGGGEESHEFTDIRDRRQPRHTVPPNLTPLERLGLEDRTPKRRAPITWKTPEGWEEYDAASQMRTASWRVKGVEQTDCSLTLLPSGGGIAANVNRWRGEMGLAPIDDAAAKGLPKRRMLGMEGTYIDLEGAFSGGRSSGGAIATARMLGIILQGPAASVFVKFVGPADVVAESRPGFESLVDSMVFDPMGTAGATRGAAGGAARGGAAAGKLAWDTPEKWTPQAPRRMREATFIPEDMPTGWCYIGLIGGGIEPNLNRWRGEMGHAPLSAKAIGRAPKLPFGGSEGVFQELKGAFRGTGGPPQKDATMFAFIGPRGPGMFVFVKMVGPAAEMGAQKERFVALCKSLR